MIKLGTNLPEHLIGTDPVALAEFLTALEELGYDYVTVGDHVLGADLSARPDWRPFMGKEAIYERHMVWHEPLVLFGSGKPLLGMRLLEHYKVTLDCRNSRIRLHRRQPEAALQS